MKQILFITIFFLFIGNVAAQEIECDIRINVESLTAEARDNLSEFAQQMKQYINGQKWTKEEFPQKIKLDIEIFFQGTKGDNHYIAQAFIGSQRPIYKANRNTASIRIRDDKWEFDYVRSQSITHDEYRFDPLLSFFDFYAYLILGFDFDSYQNLDGTKYFEKAFEIVNRSRGGNAGTGWESTSSTSYSRGQLIEEILNPKYGDIRKAFYNYHYNGIDLLGRKPEKAQTNIFNAIESIGKLKDRLNQQTLLMKVFFDTKYQEIAETFLNYSDKTVYQKISKIDPSHEKTYTEFAERREK